METLSDEHADLFLLLDDPEGLLLLALSLLLLPTQPLTLLLSLLQSLLKRQKKIGK